MSKKRTLSETTILEEKKQILDNLELIAKKKKRVDNKIIPLEKKYKLIEDKIVDIKNDQKKIKDEIKNMKQKLDEFIDGSISESDISHLEQLYTQKLNDKQINLFKNSTTDKILVKVYKDLSNILHDYDLNIIKQDNFAVFKTDIDTNFNQFRILRDYSNHYILFVCKNAIIDAELRFKYNSYSDTWYYRELTYYKFKSGNYPKLLGDDHDKIEFEINSDISKHINNYILEKEEEQDELARNSNVNPDNFSNNRYINYDMKYERLYFLVRIDKLNKGYFF